MDADTLEETNLDSTTTKAEGGGAPSHPADFTAETEHDCRPRVGFDPRPLILMAACALALHEAGVPLDYLQVLLSGSL